MPSATHRGCPICGSPDVACGGSHSAVKAIGLPSDGPTKFSGPIVEAMKPGSNGPYRVRARLEEAQSKGWEIVGGEPDTAGTKDLGGGWYELPDGTKVRGKAKARTALNKARGPGGTK